MVDFSEMEEEEILEIISQCRDLDQGEIRKRFPEIFEDLLSIFPYKGCFTRRSTRTVTVLSILSLTTEPVWILNAFSLMTLYHHDFHLLRFLRARYLYAAR